MAEKKRQHYVPQFYLRWFASDENRKRISIFNLSSQKLIHNAAIKDQAYKNNFYGEDKVIENVLGLIEGDAAEIIRKIVFNNYHPAYNSRDHQAIRTFTLLLYARTQAHVDKMNESIHLFGKSILSELSDTKDNLEEIKFEMSNQQQFIILNTLAISPLTQDLGFKLLINQTKQSFFCSDNPVIFYNQYFETRRKWSSNTGLAASGLQIFMPLTPKHYLIFYDAKMYKVGNLIHKPVIISNINDVINLNGLQYLNANENLYCDSTFTEYDIVAIISMHLKYLRTKMNQDEKTSRFIKENGEEELLYRSYNVDIRCNLNLSFIRPTPFSKNFRMDGRYRYVRDPIAYDLSSSFEKECKNGKYKFYEFHDYLEDFANNKIRNVIGNERADSKGQSNLG